MNSSFKPLALSLLIASLALTASACQEYEPPPEAQLIRSGSGAYAVGESLMMEFSAPIVAESLQVTLWPAARGTRRVPLDNTVEPLVGPCSTAKGCDELALELDSANKTATITLDESLSGPGSTFILEIQPGLEDQTGNITGASYFYTVRYRATAGDPNANIQFDNGVFILGGAVNKPMRAVLTLVSHIQILPDGRFAMVGAKGVVTDEDAPDTTRDPNIIEIEDGEWGWTLFATGLVVENAQGERFLETEPFDVEIPVLNGSIFLDMQDVRLFANIIKDENGNDFIDGTLTYEKLILTPPNNNPPAEYPGESTALLGNFVPTELIPAGTPDMCDAICGGVTGICEPPEDFPHPDFCNDTDDTASETDE